MREFFFSRRARGEILRCSRGGERNGPSIRSFESSSFSLFDTMLGLFVTDDPFVLKVAHSTP